MKFYDEIVRYYDLIFPLADAKLTFMEDLIERRGARSLLDVGCATGTFCWSIADKMAEVDGFDLDQEMVTLASNTYQGDHLSFCVGNMLNMSEVFPGKSYDLITCFGNTLVHLDEGGVLKAFKSIKQRLNEGGAFVGQILNYDHIFDQEIKNLPLIDNDRISFDRTYDWEGEGRLTFRATLTVKATGAQFDNAIDLYPLRRKTLEKLLLQAGFKSMTFYKNYQGAEAGGQHYPLIFLVE